MIREKKIAILIVGIYLLFLPAGIYMTTRFFSHTSLSYDAPKHTLVYDSTAPAKEYFPTQIPLDPLYMLLQEINSTHSVVSDGLLENYCYFLRQSILTPGHPLSYVAIGVTGYFLVPDVGAIRSRTIGGENNESTVMLVTVQPNATTTGASDVITVETEKWFAAQGVEPTFTVSYTSIAFLMQDAKDGLVGDLMKIDAVALPLAFIALVYCVKAVRLLLVPACSLIVSVILTFSIMYPISYGISISAMAPEQAIAVMSAISVDYALFILTRFREQLKIYKDETESPEKHWKVVRQTAVLSAHNILISGVSIAVAIGTLGILPVNLVATIGITMCVGVVCAMVVSLTIQPALLLIFYGFFSRNIPWCSMFRAVRRCLTGCCAKSEVSEGESTAPFSGEEVDLPTEESPTPIHTDEPAAKNERETPYKSIWFKIGRLAVCHPFLISAVVVLIGVPFFYFATRIRVDFSTLNEIPSNSEHGRTLEFIQSNIGNGAAVPFYLTFIVRPSLNISFWHTDTMMDYMKLVLQEVHDRTGQPYTGVLAPNMVPPGVIPGVDEPLWLTALQSETLYATVPEYQYMVNSSVSPLDMRGAFAALTTVFDPFGAEAGGYLDMVLEVIKDLDGPDAPCTVGLVGASSTSWAALRRAMKYFPIQVGVTFGAMLVVVGLCFRSIFIPVRMVLTIAYTVAFAYGVGVIVFQYTWLRPVWPALNHVESYLFIIPIFTFSLLSALALDYDVFLITRIVEYKTAGSTNRDAIMLAVWKTGPIISIAGIVMFFTIGGMTFSNTMMVAQFGVVCAIAVLVDTFIIRPLLVPALMSMVPSIVWWPRKFSKPPAPGDDSTEADGATQEKRESYSPQAGEESSQHHEQSP